MMDAEEAALFTKSVQQAVAFHAGAEHDRPSQTGAGLDGALLELGWAEALDVSPAIAVGALFTAQGLAAATSSALRRVLGAGLGLDAPVLLPALGRHDPPGSVAGNRVRVDGLAIDRVQSDPLAVDGVHVDGLAVGAALEAGSVLVPFAGGVVRVATTDLALRPVHGLDPGFGLVKVTGTAAVASSAPAGQWATAVALGHRALAAELVGAGRAMLELARVHALDREQFGRPISAFQAVRHRLADTLVTLESADDLIAASWEDDSPVLATMAKAVAGRAARTAARHCQQVLAGIGFTTEHRFHVFLRRALLLDELLGSSRTLTRELGEDLLATRRLPALLPL